MICRSNRIKIHKPSEIAERVGGRGGHTSTVEDIIPFLPKTLCFFDCRHFVVGVNEIPFALSTRTHANNQQYLQVVEEYEL